MWRRAKVRFFASWLWTRSNASWLTIAGTAVTLFGPPDSAKMCINAMNALHRVRPGERPATLTRPEKPGMPLGLPPLEDEEIALVMAWIAQGLPE